MMNETTLQYILKNKRFKKSPYFLGDFGVYSARIIFYDIYYNKLFPTFRHYLRHIFWVLKFNDSLLDQQLIMNDYCYQYHEINLFQQKQII